MDYIKLAKAIDMFRIIPRTLVLGYLLAVGISLHWYFNFPLEYVTECNAGVLQVLIDNGASIKEAELVACSKTEIIGRPVGYTTLFSVLIGAGAGIFGFYTSTGWKWKNDATDNNSGIK